MTPNKAMRHGCIRKTGCPAGVQDRPGHDRRYAINPAKAQAALSWRPQTDFATGLTALTAWYTANQPWWQRVKSGEYREYAEK